MILSVNLKINKYTKIHTFSHSWLNIDIGSYNNLNYHWQSAVPSKSDKYWSTVASWAHRTSLTMGEMNTIEWIIVIATNVNYLGYDNEVNDRSFSWLWTVNIRIILSVCNEWMVYDYIKNQVVMLLVWPLKNANLDWTMFSPESIFVI